MFKFLHAADIHLDSALHGLARYEGAPVDDVRSATRRAFDNLIELAITESVDFVLLAGDLYDGDWKDYNTGLYFVERMRRLKDAEIKVFIIAGNHDAASQITRYLRLPENVKMFSTQHPEQVILDDLNVAINGQGFANRAVLDDLSQSYQNGDPQLFNIGLLHTCLDGKPGHAPYAPCTIDGLRSKGYQYWALGHVHKREIIAEDPWIIFPGNSQGRHIRETGNKGCTLVSVDNAEIVSVQHRNLDVLRWRHLTVNIEGCSTIDDVYEKISAEFQQSLDSGKGRPVAARLSLVGSAPAHAKLHAEREYWTQEFRVLASGMGGAGLWVEKVSVETQGELSLEIVLERDNALGGLLKSIHDVEFDDNTLADIASEIVPLRQKLPPELLSGEDRFVLDDPERLKTTLGEVKELLMARLLTSRKE